MTRLLALARRRGTLLSLAALLACPTAYAQQEEEGPVFGVLVVLANALWRCFRVVRRLVPVTVS